MPKHKTIQGTAVEDAVSNLRDLFNHLSQLYVLRFGVGYQAQPEAPETWEALQDAWQLARSNKTRLPVSSLHCESTIYGSPATNHALRFVHDVGHLVHGLGFSFDEELDLACHHLDVVRGIGFRPTSLEHGIVHADFFGQAYCQMVLGRFPLDQQRFVLDCLTFDVDTAVQLEATSDLEPA